MGKLGSLGSLSFVVSSNTIRTFEKLQWDVGASYATHDRHMMPDLLEFLGPDLETISLPIKFSVFLGTNPIGGLCGVLVGALNQAPRFYNAPVALQAAAGAAVVLAVEFASGCVLNLWLGLGVWDYSGLPGNVLGQICPTFGLLWFLLMPFAIWAEDTARWCIWFYEMSLMPPGKPDVKTPLPALYSLKSIYSDFIKGK